jgi:predicted DNA-binding protein (UPF0251 family)
MPRPQNCRRIAFLPDVTVFKPAGIPGRTLPGIVLSLDELEAIRLADLEGLYQEEAASRMEVSRQTFGNIISSAHAKLADCIVNGKMLRIEGGSVMVLQQRRFECSECGHAWNAPHGTGRPQRCPSCSSANFHRAADDRGPHGMGRGMGFGHCGGQGRRRAAVSAAAEGKQDGGGTK